MITEKLLKIRVTQCRESFLRGKEIDYSIILKYILRFLGINNLHFTPGET